MGNRGDFEAVVNVTANASEARKEFAQLMREFAGTEAEFHAKLVSDRGEFKTFINKLQNAAQKHGIKIDIDTSAFDTAINEANRLQKALDSISLDSITDQFKGKKGLKANLFNISEKEAKAQAGQARAIIEKLVLGDRGKNQLLKSGTWGKFRDGKLASFNPGKEIELESLVAKNDVLFDRYEKKLANLNGMINRDSINNQDTLMDAYKLVYEISELQKEISRFNPKIVDKDENGKNKLLYNVDENIYENLRKKLEPTYQKVSAKISESLGISSNNIGSLADNLLEELVKVFQKASIPVEVEPKVDGDKFVEEVQKKVKGKKAQVEVEPVTTPDGLTEDQKKLQAEAEQRLNVLRNNLQTLINANKSGDQNLRKGILKQYAGKMSQFMDATEMPSEQDFFEFAKGFDNIKPYFGIFDDQKPVEVKVDVKPEVKPESVKKEVEKKTSKTKPKVEVTPVVDDKSDGKPSGDSKNILLTPDVTEFKKKSDEELAKIQLDKNVELKPDITGFEDSAKEKLSEIKIEKNIEANKIKLSENESEDTDGLKIDIVPDVKDPVGFVNEASKQLGENKVKVDITSEFEPITFIDEAERKLKNVPIEVEIIPKDVDPARFTAYTEGQINKEPIKLDVEPNINVELFIAQTQAQIGDKRVDINVEPLVDPVVFARDIELQAEKATPKVNVGIGAVDSSSISESSELTALLGILGQIIGKIREKNEAFKQEEKIVGKVMSNETRRIGTLAVTLDTVLDRLNKIADAVKKIDFASLKLPDDLKTSEMDLIKKAVKDILDARKKSGGSGGGNSKSPSDIDLTPYRNILKYNREIYRVEELIAALEANPNANNSPKVAGLREEIKILEEKIALEEEDIKNQKLDSTTEGKQARSAIAEQEAKLTESLSEELRIQNAVFDENARLIIQDADNKKVDAEWTEKQRAAYEELNVELDRYHTLKKREASGKSLRGDKEELEAIENNIRIKHSQILSQGLINPRKERAFTNRRIGIDQNLKDIRNQKLANDRKKENEAIDREYENKKKEAEAADVKLLREAAEAANAYSKAQAEAIKNPLAVNLEVATQKATELDEALDKLIITGGNFKLSSYEEFTDLSEELENADIRIRKATEQKEANDKKRADSKAEQKDKKDKADAKRLDKEAKAAAVGGLYKNIESDLKEYETIVKQIAKGEADSTGIAKKEEIYNRIFETLSKIEGYENQKDSDKYNGIINNLDAIDKKGEELRIQTLQKADVDLLKEATKAAREYGIAQAEAEKSDLPAVMERAADAGKKLDDVLDRLIINGGNLDLASYKEFSGLTDALENAEYKVNKAKQEQQRKTASKEGLTEEQKKVVTLQEKYDDLIKSAKEYVKLAIGVNRETGGYKDEVKASRFDELKKDISDAKQGIGEYQSVVAGATSIQDKFNASLDEAFDEAGKESIADLQTRIAGLSEKKGFKTPAYDKYIDELNADLTAIRSKLPLDFMNEEEVKDFAHSLDEIYKKIEKSNAKEFTPVNALTLQSAEKGFEKWVDNNSAALRKFGGEIEEIRRDFSNVVSAADLDKVKSKFYELQMQVARTGAAGRSMWDTWKDRAKSFMAYLGTYVGFYDILQKLREGFDIAVTYDTQLTEMKKVSDETMASLKEFQKASFALGDSVGTTGQQVQASTADFMRLGESLDKAAQSALDANTLFKVSEFESIEEATEALISMSQAYQELEKSEINDIANHIGKELPKHVVIHGDYISRQTTISVKI